MKNEIEFSIENLLCASSGLSKLTLNRKLVTSPRSFRFSANFRIAPKNFFWIWVDATVLLLLRLLCRTYFSPFYQFFISWTQFVILGWQFCEFSEFEFCLKRYLKYSFDWFWFDQSMFGSCLLLEKVVWRVLMELWVILHTISEDEMWFIAKKIKNFVENTKVDRIHYLNCVPFHFISYQKPRNLLHPKFILSHKTQNQT